MDTARAVSSVQSNYALLCEQAYQQIQHSACSATNNTLHGELQRITNCGNNRPIHQDAAVGLQYRVYAYSYSNSQFSRTTLILPPTPLLLTFCFAVVLHSSSFRRAPSTVATFHLLPCRALPLPKRQLAGAWARLVAEPYEHALVAGRARRPDCFTCQGLIKLASNPKRRSSAEGRRAALQARLETGGSSRTAECFVSNVGRRDRPKMSVYSSNIATSHFTLQRPSTPASSCFCRPSVATHTYSLVVFVPFSVLRRSSPDCFGGAEARVRPPFEAGAERHLHIIAARSERAKVALSQSSETLGKRHCSQLHADSRPPATQEAHKEIARTSKRVGPQSRVWRRGRNVCTGHASLENTAPLKVPLGS